MSRVHNAPANLAAHEGSFTSDDRRSCNPWWAAVDSNHLPPRYQHGALPVELAAHGFSKRIAPSETDEAELYHGHESALGGAQRRRQMVWRSPNRLRPDRVDYIAEKVS